MTDATIKTIFKELRRITRKIMKEFLASLSEELRQELINNLPPDHGLWAQILEDISLYRQTILSMPGTYAQLADVQDKPLNVGADRIWNTLKDLEFEDLGEVETQAYQERLCGAFEEFARTKGISITG